MTAWLKLTNIAWFRQMVAEEANEVKRRELQQKLDQAEAELHADLFKGSDGWPVHV